MDVRRPGTVGGSAAPLSALLVGINGLTRFGDQNPVIRGIACHSKAVNLGDLFACIRGSRDDGHRYAREAVDDGPGVPRLAGLSCLGNLLVGLGVAVMAGSWLALILLLGGSRWCTGPSAAF